jgi:uncharacterized protein YkwD
MPIPPRLLRAALVAVLTVPLLASPATAREPCVDANAEPGKVADADLRRALRCVVNDERAARGMQALKPHGALGEAAQDHAADMVRRGYFAHERPGSTPAGRLRRADWRGSAAAEAIAWGCGGLGTPRAIVDAWLASSAHRELLLGRYGRAGIGLQAGSPYGRDCPGAGTWVLFVGRG